MSDNNVASSSNSGETQLVAEYKDGKLQIVDVAPFDKNGKMIDNSDGYILPEIIEENQLQHEKGLLQLDLLNLTLVKCEDGEESYRLVANTEEGSEELSGENTVACVLQSSDGEEVEGQESYVMVEGEQGPLVFLQPATVSATQQSQQQQQQRQQQQQQQEEEKKLTPAQFLEKAKQIEQAKAKAVAWQQTGRGRGRKRSQGLPPARELLASPNFKLFLYSCKMCPFRCNAVKDLTHHKAECHSSGRGGSSSRGGRGLITLQCARCPYRAPSRDYLTKHVNEKHVLEEATASLYYSDKISLDSAEVAAADVLVCGACGFESASRPVFREHIETQHGATTV